MIQFNPKGKKRMTIKECFEPVQFISGYDEAAHFFVAFLKFMLAKNVDYDYGILSPLQQAKHHLKHFLALNKNEDVKGLIGRHFEI